MTQLYTTKHLIEQLKLNKLPHSKTTILLYEEAGIIPKPELQTEWADNVFYRLYTKEEIFKTIVLVKSYVECARAELAEKKTKKKKSKKSVDVDVDVQ